MSAITSLSVPRAMSNAANLRMSRTFSIFRAQCSQHVGVEGNSLLRRSFHWQLDCVKVYLLQLSLGLDKWYV